MMETILDLETRIANIEKRVKRLRGEHGQTVALLRTMRGLRTEQLRLENEARDNAIALHQWIKATDYGVRAT